MIDTKEVTICPRCGTEFLVHLAALSRRDNKTLICSECGTMEAMEDFFKMTYMGQPYWKENNGN